MRTPIAFLLPLLMLMLGCSSQQKLSGPTAAQSRELTTELENMLDRFEGDAGLYLMHLPSGMEISIHADTIFPTASNIKIPILVGLFDKIHRGEIGYRDELIYRDSIAYGGSGLMQFFRDSVTTDVSTLAALMITFSDNTTSLWSQALAGGGERINEIMEDYGFQHTRVNSRTPGREHIRQIYGWGQTTPRELATLVRRIRQGELISPAASDRMYRLLKSIYYDEGALARIPKEIATASKTGTVSDSRSEVVLVHAPSGDYVFAIMTKNNKDRRWVYENEAAELIRDVSSVIWNHLEPDHQWMPYEQRF